MELMQLQLCNFHSVFPYLLAEGASGGVIKAADSIRVGAFSLAPWGML